MSSDMEGITGSMLLFLLCLVSLTNANTSPTIGQRLFEVCEDTPVGAIAFTIEATDAESDPLTYELIGANAVYFTVNRNTGAVSIEIQLDREGLGNLMQLQIRVSDGRSETTATLSIVINDANDNKPLFQLPSYDKSIEENAAIGTPLFTVRATDFDTSSAGVVQYSIEEVTPSEGFSLFSISSTTGEVKLSGSLDYVDLSTFYRIKIKATDGGGKCYYDTPTILSSVVYSVITVVDVPDLDPIFTGVPYFGRVEENSPTGQSVFQVAAIDQDLGINDNMIYSIEVSTVEGLFQISTTDGIISVLSSIDRETVGDSVILTVKAAESQLNIQGNQASTTAKVQIEIVDVNDNPPEFYNCAGDENSCVKATEFTGEVFENFVGAVSINMMVKDLDKISNTELTLAGPDMEVFSVEPQSTISDSIVQLLVKQPEKLDFEKIQQMVLQVIAKDQDEPTFKSTATVTITIKDTNDNSPTFQQSTYKLSVPEHSPVGTTLETITAEDPDTMDQGKIIYKLRPDSILQYFNVNSSTGAIYVVNERLLDREVRSLYSATLEARDTDNKPGTTVLEITLTDINDNPPVMNRDSYVEFVKEGGQLELKIQATDADDPDTKNSQLVYAILPSKYSNYFTIDPNTGVLRNKGELDREALDPDLEGRIELNVTATDQGTPPLSAMVTVIINVEDVNDNKPEFKKSSYTFSVKEGEKGAFVGSVFAEDLDQTLESRRISFSIIDGSFGSFIIRSFEDGQEYRGNITVDPDIELDYESARKQFNLRVEAADLGSNKAEVMVEVNVMDVNDERPEFKPILPVTVKENTTISGAVGSFIGQDKDGNHSLIYEEVSIKCRCNNTLTKCTSVILDPSGEVRVNPEEILDYEQCNQVLIEAQVVDEYTEKGENNSVTTGEMVINIEDINDNAPEFILSDAVFVVVSESASKGTSVAGVTATDRDSGINRQIDFKVTAVKFQNTNNITTTMRMLFDVVTTQQKDIYVGIIQTTEGLDMKLKGKYLVTVTATDTGGLSTDSVLDIFTVDETYKVELEFTSTAAEVENNINDIIRALAAATKTAVEIVAIRSGIAESRAVSSTFVVAYFVYSNGTALTSSEVEKMISSPQHALALAQLGLANIGTVPVSEPEIDPVKYVLLGMVGGLVIVLAVLTTSLMCTRRNYRRKLKASKAMNSASMVTSDNQKSGAVVPGTNKYTMEGANPVLNLNIDTTLVLGLDDEDSDVDKVSLNSLDNIYEMTVSEKDTKSMMMIQEEEEEEEDDDDDNGLPGYIEPLGAALAQRGQKKGSDKPSMAFNNPVFSTTDL